MGELSGKTALIVGADEIGAGIGARFTREGAAVTTTDSPGDLPASLDIVVANMLGEPSLAPLENQDLAFAAAIETVTRASAILRQALPLLRDRGGGRIIVVGHRYGECVSEGLGPYNAAAWALVGLVRTAAVEWGRYAITTNLLIPFADTAELRRAHQQRPKIIDLMIGQTPMQRAGDPVEDIGGAALFLAGDDAAFVNGQVLYADGGQHVAGPVLNPIRFAKS